MTKTNPLSEQEQRAWAAHQKMSVRLFGELNRELMRTTRISLPDYEVLEALAMATDNQLRSYELGGELQWEKSRLSHHLKRMENRDLVARVVCESDGRGLWVTLTKRGGEVFSSAAPIHTEYVKRNFIGALSPEHLINFTEAAEKIIADLPGGSDLCDH